MFKVRLEMQSCDERRSLTGTAPSLCQVQGCSLARLTKDGNDRFQARSVLWSATLASRLLADLTWLTRASHPTGPKMHLIFLLALTASSFGFGLS